MGCEYARMVDVGEAVNGVTHPLQLVDVDLTGGLFDGHISPRTTGNQAVGKKSDVGRQVLS